MSILVVYVVKIGICQIKINLKYELDVYMMFISFSVNFGWLSELLKIGLLSNLSS